MRWRRGRGAVDDPLRSAVALRIGLRYVRNLGEAEITRIEAARAVRGRSCRPRIWPSAPGCRSMRSRRWRLQGRSRRSGWGGGRASGRQGPWPGWVPTGCRWLPGTAAPRLAGDGRSRGRAGRPVVHGDLGDPSCRLPARSARRCRAASRSADALRLRTHGTRARVGGIITHRQRPGTAKGVRFLNLEDETGLLNVVVLPQVWEAHYEIARKAIGVVIEGVLEFRDGVTNLVAHRFEALAGRWCPQPRLSVTLQSYTHRDTPALGPDGPSAPLADLNPRGHEQASRAVVHACGISHDLVGSGSRGTPNRRFHGLRSGVHGDHAGCLGHRRSCGGFLGRMDSAPVARRRPAPPAVRRSPRRCAASPRRSDGVTRGSDGGACCHEGRPRLVTSRPCSGTSRSRCGVRSCTRARGPNRSLGHRKRR